MKVSSIGSSRIFIRTESGFIRRLSFVTRSAESSMVKISGAACEEIPTRAAIKHQTKRHVSPERRVFLDYSHRIGRVGLSSDKYGCWHTPLDVYRIMKKWRGVPSPRGESIAPTDQEMARLDQYLAVPMKYAVFIRHKREGRERWEEIAANPDVHPALLSTDPTFRPSRVRACGDSA